MSSASPMPLKLAAAAFISPTSFKDETSYPRVRNLRVRSYVASKQQSLQFSKVKSQKLEKIVRIGVLGASGYTGSEVMKHSASSNLLDQPSFQYTLCGEEEEAQTPGLILPVGL